MINTMVKLAVERRATLDIGDTVDIILKKDQRTGRLTRGVVAKILTSKGKHTRGIKVRLVDGQVGRADTIIKKGNIKNRNK